MARRKLTLSQRVNKYLGSSSLAKAGRKKLKIAKRTTKKAVKSATRTQKRFRRFAKKKAKRLPKKLRKAKRFLKRGRKNLAKSIRLTRKEFKKRSRAYQLRGKQLKNRRQEKRQEIKGKPDTSWAVVVKANSDPGASKPGEPPKMRSGEGRYSIKAELRQRGKQIVSRTYVDKKIAKYMAMWEFRQDGKQRPFLKPGLMNNLKQFQTKVGAELKRAATAVPKKKAVVK